MTDVFDTLLEAYGPEAMTLLAIEWAPRILGALVVIAVTLLVSWALNRAFRTVFARVGLDVTAAAFIRTVTRFALITIGLLMALGQLGIDTTSILTSLGVLGLTIGFAAQNTLSNVISGLFIFWDRPFVIGDLVEADGEYGRVDSITLRSTRLVTVDGKMISVPNTVMANQKVASYTNFPHLRLDIEVTIGVNESIDRVRGLMLHLIEGDERFMTEPAPMVHVKALNDYNVLVVFKPWIENERDHVAIRSELRQKIKESFDEAGVEMPFETLSITPLTLKQTA